MKRIGGAIFLGVGAVVLLFVGLALGQPSNPSFETGNTNGWEADATSGEIEVVTECGDEVGECPSPFAPYDAQSGRSFALLTAGSEGDFVTLSQTLTVPGGSTVSAWVFFCNAEVTDEIGDCDTDEMDEEEPGQPGAGALNGRGLGTAQLFQYCDEVRVAYQIGGESGPFQEAYNVNACDDLSTDWTQIVFSVDAALCRPVEVTFIAGIRNVGDGSVPSRMGLDNLRVNEPTCREDRPNIGAGLSGLFNGMPTPLPTAPSAVAPAATAPVITPPRTGDAGLAESTSTPLYGVAAAGFVLAGISVHRLLRR